MFISNNINFILRLITFLKENDLRKSQEELLIYSNIKSINQSSMIEEKAFVYTIVFKCVSLWNVLHQIISKT